MQDRTIAGVLDRLDGIIERCHVRGSRLGFFPAMYRKTTAEVKKGIETGRFENPERMERLDVVFADRYIDAFEQHERGEPPAEAWDYAFLMGGSPAPTVIQHLLLGMNAHINLDLGISAAEVAPGPSLGTLKRDFDEINTILGELVDGVQDDLGGVFPVLRALDFLCFRLDEMAVHTAVKQARATAWEKAVTLARCEAGPERDRHIAHFDRQTVRVARTICSPAHLAAVHVGREDIDDPATIRRIIEALVD